LADDAVGCQSVSKPKFPANREINREFCGFRPSCAIFAPSQRANSMASGQIPYAMEQGIFLPEQGKFWSEQGILISGSMIDRTIIRPFE
jgi:hypothetical protein